jgi:predicted nucleotidyltransferase
MGDVEAVERTLREALAGWECVRAAWLFGSVAEASAGPLSDVDVAVLGCAALSLDEIARLAAELSRATGRPCDIVVVERASPVLGMQVVQAGRRILSRDDEAADRWEDFALRRYLGTVQLRKIVYEHVRQDLLGTSR